MFQVETATLKVLLIKVTTALLHALCQVDKRLNQQFKPLNLKGFLKIKRRNNSEKEPIKQCSQNTVGLAAIRVLFGCCHSSNSKTKIDQNSAQLAGA
jgi:hypothetical protein